MMVYWSALRVPRGSRDSCAPMTCTLMSESCCRMTVSLAIFLFLSRPCLLGILTGRALTVHMRMSICLSLEVSLKYEVCWSSVYLSRKCLQSLPVGPQVGVLGVVVRLLQLFQLSLSVGVKGSCPFFLWAL
eukprot:3720572-Pyramimonas_sp.AAC.1